MKKTLLSLCLCCISLILSAQTKSISGKIIDDDSNAPLPFASVLLKGTSTGVVADDAGNFIIQLPATATAVDISVQSIGYQEQTISATAGDNVTIRLKSDAKLLGDVVVVAYGTQKKKNITGAVSSYKADDLDKRPVTRLDQALVGQLAGVQVKQTSGAPGKGFSINIRGAGSISASNEPLYVIDGFPLETSGQNSSGGFSTGNPLDNINPNDIESIQVLKDASAAAIYGSRAANGVVIISTKKGASGKPKLGVNVYTGIVKAVRKLDMLSAEEWVDRSTEMINAQWVASGTGRLATQTTAERAAILKLAPGVYNASLMLDDRWAQPGHPGLSYYDYQDEAFRTGSVSNYQLNASGGNNFVKYYVSGNYLDQQAYTLNTYFKSYSARANIEVNANSQLKFGLNVAPSYSITQDPGIDGKDNIIHIIAGHSPVQEDTMGLDGNVGKNGQYLWSTSRNNPVRQMENITGLSKNFRTLSTAYIDYELLRGLNFRSSLNFDNTDVTSKRYSPDFINGSQSARATAPGTSTSGSYNGLRKQTLVNENTLNFNRIIGGAHDISAIAGYSYHQTKIDNVRLTSSGGFSSSTITTLNAAATISGTGSNFTNETKSVLLSAFGRLQYGFKDKYLLSASLRRDGSSRFGLNQKWGWFPSASLGWRVIEEPFMHSVKLFSDLKLRGSWGKGGNYNIGDYSSIPTLGFSNYTFGGAQASGQTPNRIANPDLTWEKSETKNIGFDAGLMSNRLYASFDYYTRRNTDLLLNVPLPLASGFATALSNIGEVLNKGWEVELTTRNLVGKFQWTTNLNFSHNENKVIHLAPGDADILIPSLFDIQHSILRVGQPMYSNYLVQMVGILSQADIDGKAPLFGTEKAGDPKYLDANGDGKIDANDRVLSGQPNPKYIWGVTNTFKFAGFDLSCLVQGQTGGTIYSLFGRAVDRTGQGNVDNYIGILRNRWRSEANPGDGLRGKAYSTFGRIKNTDWLWASDYWRIRNITLGYDLGKILKSQKVQGTRLYITAENWFGKDKYLGGWNPEALNTDLSGDASFPQGGDYGGAPLSRSIIAGVNVTF
jgi:TonB-dependent starch-binding outer membrane protein SusC